MSAAESSPSCSLDVKGRSTTAARRRAPTVTDVDPQIPKFVPRVVSSMSVNDVDAVRLAVEALQRGELVAMPTETVYGLAANAWSDTACRRIFAAKGRPADNPLIVHVADRSRLSEAAAVPSSGPIRDRLDAVADLWPGPLTLVLPVGPLIPRVVTAGRTTVAVRVPAHPVALELLAGVPFPLAAPSANRSTAISPTRAEDVREELGDRVALVLDGGSCRCGLESTIVSLVEPDGPRLLRFGAMPAEYLAHRFDLPLSHLLRGMPEANGSHSAPATEADGVDRPGAIAPGQMRLHYAPRTPLWLLSDPGLPEPLVGRWGRIRFREPLNAEVEFAEVRTVSRDGDPIEIAAKLFETLRELDRLPLDGILIDTCEEAGIGRAIMDRLRRASANR